MRGATLQDNVICMMCDISIHAPRAGSDATQRRCTVLQCISIHAPRAGSDGITFITIVYMVIFQSTLPVRGATGLSAKSEEPLTFQSTLPVRGATRTRSNGYGLVRFQSTLPVRGATWQQWLACGLCVISIHAPRAGSDEKLRVQQCNEGIISIHAPRAGSDL